MQKRGPRSWARAKISLAITDLKEHILYMKETQMREAVNTLFDSIADKTIDDESAVKELTRLKAVRGKSSKDIGRFNNAMKVHPKFKVVVETLGKYIVK